MADPYLDLTQAATEVTSTELSTGGGAPFWGDNPEAWDAVYIAGLRVPGVCDVKCDAEQHVDKKHIKGKHGATFTQLGYKPAKVDIKVTLWTPAQLESYLTFVNNVRPRGPLKNTPGLSPAESWGVVAIQHPACSVIGIHAVMVMKITAPEGQGDIKTAQIHCEEFIAPSVRKKGTVATAKGATDGLAPTVLGPKVAADQAALHPPSETSSGPSK